MKLSDFKLEEVRKEFVVDINGEVEKVTVYNILDEEREEIRNKISEIIKDKNVLEAEEVEEVYNILFKTCTNIEVDEETIDTINNPNKDMILILNEVKEILDELYLEVLLNQSQQLSEIEKGLVMKRNLLRGEKIELLGRDCKRIKNEIDLIKRVKEKNKLLEDEEEGEEYDI